jgi:hypothetical protein
MGGDSLRCFFEQKLFHIENLQRSFTDEELNDLPYFVSVSLQHQFAVFEAASGDFSFPLFQNNDTIFEFAMDKGFPIEFNFLVRKSGIPVTNLIGFHRPSKNLCPSPIES